MGRSDNNNPNKILTLKLPENNLIMPFIAFLLMYSGTSVRFHSVSIGKVCYNIAGWTLVM